MGRVKGGHNKIDRKIWLKCLFCGKLFPVRAYRKFTAKFCSLSCHAKYQYPRCVSSGFGSSGLIPWNKKYLDPKEGKRINALKRYRTVRGKLHNLISSYIRESLHGNKNHRNLQDLVGYNVDELKIHLEGLMKPGMTWENHGKYGWHIDHKLPISHFSFNSPEDEDFKKCWSLENLQPLWAIENLTKSAHILKEESNV